jgi:hypothetical protein
MRWRTRLGRVAATLDRALLGSVVTLLRANSKVRHKIKGSSPKRYEGNERLSLATEKLEDALAVSVDRLQRIEAKATSTVVGVGIAVTILGSATAILSSDGPLASSGTGVRVAVAVLLIVGMLFLLLSGYLALRAYAIARVYRPELQDIVPLTSEKEARKILLYCLDQNDRVGTLKANLLSASFDCLRNGLVLVAVLAVLLVLGSLSASPAGDQPRFRADNAPRCHSNR